VTPDVEHEPYLRELEARLGAAGFAEILDSLAEAVTIRDPHHHILYANRAAVQSMGFSSLAEMLRRPTQSIFGEYVVEDEFGNPLTMHDIPSVRLLAGEPAPPLLMRNINRASGTVHWRLLKASPLHDGNGRLVAAVTIIEDVTREKVAEMREGFLSRATATLMASLDYEETLRHVVQLAVPEVADWCAVDLLDPRGQRQQVAVAHRDPSKAALAVELERLRPTRLDPEAGIGRVFRTGDSELYPVITEEMLDTSAQRLPEYTELLKRIGMRSAMICPLRARGRTLGAITFVCAESFRRFDESDRDFADQIAARAAVAVDNARLATERREISVTLQQSLLPDVLPRIDGWDVAAMYRPAGAGQETEVGGDFYDFFETRAGWVVLLGDVTGKGVQAAAMTALVRHGARFLSKQQPSPSAIFVELDAALREQGGLSLCTAVCLRLQDDYAIISSAGHPPPLIVRDDGRIRELGVLGAILGAWSGGRWVDRRTPLGPDETLVIYTDGVTDLPGERERFGLGRLRSFLVKHAGAPPDQLLSRLEDEMTQFQSGGLVDDTAVLALRPTLVDGPRESGSGISTPTALKASRSMKRR